MLLAIFMLYNSAGITGYQILCYLEFNKEIQYFVFVMVFLLPCMCTWDNQTWNVKGILGVLIAKLIKLLKFLSRLFASTAHGSTCGRSARVLLNLGGYGCCGLLTACKFSFLILLWTACRAVSKPWWWIWEKNIHVYICFNCVYKLGMH